MCAPARRKSISKASLSRSRKARISSTPRAKPSCAATSPNGATKPTCRASPAPWRSRTKGNTPLYLDMSPIPEALQDYFIQSKVKWMDYFFRKLGSEARTDMFGKTPYYALNQMTKMGIRTGADCRSDVPGLWRRPGAGRLRQSLRRLPHRALRRQRLDRRTQRHRGPRPAAAAAARWCRNSADASRHRDAARRCRQGRLRFDPARPAGGHVRLRRRHPEEGRPARTGAAPGRRPGGKFRSLSAPHTHELVRLKETEAMLLAASSSRRLALPHRARLSHFREDHDRRDDDAWLVWIDIAEGANGPAFSTMPIPTPFCSAAPLTRRPTRRIAQHGEVATAT